MGTYCAAGSRGSEAPPRRASHPPPATGPGSAPAYVRMVVRQVVSEVQRYGIGGREFRFARPTRRGLGVGAGDTERPVLNGATERVSLRPGSVAGKEKWVQQGTCRLAPVTSN